MRADPRRLVAGLALLAGAALTSCGLGSDAASWTLEPNEAMSATTTSFTAVVTRIGCTSGVQGQPEPPQIEYGKSQVVLTFDIRPHIGGGTCQGTPGVEYEVELDEPLGDRVLVDGRCLADDPSAAANCEQDGVRYRIPVRE